MPFQWFCVLGDCILRQLRAWCRIIVYLRNCLVGLSRAGNCPNWHVLASQHCGSSLPWSIFCPQWGLIRSESGSWLVHHWYSWISNSKPSYRLHTNCFQNKVVRCTVGGDAWAGKGCLVFFYCCGSFGESVIVDAMVGAFEFWKGTHLHRDRDSDCCDAITIESHFRADHFFKFIE